MPTVLLTTDGTRPFCDVRPFSWRQLLARPCGFRWIRCILCGMETRSRDDIATVAAIGLVAYVCADIAHHALGHGAACLALGGQIRSLSSIFVNCSLTGAAIDLAGPFANVVVGLVALLASHLIPRAPATRLFLVLAAAFNLFWFGLQLSFSAATRTDDWAWAIHYFHISEALRYSLVAVGALAYVFSVRVLSVAMMRFAHPPGRAMVIVVTAWITAGAIACATAAFDTNPVSAILRHAAPQSLLISAGLLFLPARAARLPFTDSSYAAIGRSVPWIVAAVIVGVVSIVYLGPGIAILT